MYKYCAGDLKPIVDAHAAEEISAKDSGEKAQKHIKKAFAK